LPEPTSSEPTVAEEREPLPPPSSPSIPTALPRRATLARRLRKAIPYVPALVPVAILVTMVISLLAMAGMSLQFSLYPFRFVFHGPVNFGWGFFGSDFNPLPSRGAPSWGILVFIVGSFLTAVPALVLAMLVGLGIAIASTSYLPRFLSRFLDPFVDLLAGIPSVIYGIWAFVLIGPYFGTVLNPWLADHLNFIPGFGGRPGPTTGDGLPLAIFVLTLMVLPITTLLIRDALRSVPRDLWESGLALGATRWEVTRRVSLPYALRGILSAGFLGFGRAFGETVAVAMILGVNAAFPVNFYSGTSTMAATMFELLDSAYGNSQFLAVLSEMALVLLAITLTVNLLGRRFVSTFAGYEIAGM
jgi:phosphate transport system permease protein